MVLGAYALWTAVWLHSGHHVSELPHIGDQFLRASQASPAISSASVAVIHGAGYDGEFFYFIAVDPARAYRYIDSPSYRYARILYPMAARALALGRPALVPAAMLALNLLAVAGGTLALAAWSRLRGLSAWYAAVYGFACGQLISIEYSLSDAAAYALAALGVYVWERSPRHRFLAAGTVFGLAALTREVTLLFPLAHLAAELWSAWRARGWSPSLAGRLAAFGLLSMGPFAVWKLALWAWVGRTEEPLGYHFTLLPLGGVAHWVRQGIDAQQAPEMGAVVVPGLIALGAGIWALVRGLREAAVVLLVVSCLGLLVFSERHEYESIVGSGRIALGMILAATLVLPGFRAARLGTAWFWLCAGMWLSLTPSMLLTRHLI